MPALDANKNRRAGVKVKRKPKPYTRPAPKSQPGPFRDSERRRVERYRSTPAYQQAIRDARKHGPATARGTIRLGEDKSDADRARGAAVSRAAIRQARIDYLRRTRPTGRALIKQELEGRGALADVLNAIGKAATNSGAIVSTGAGPNLGGRGGLPFTHGPKGGGVATALAPTVTPLKGSTAAKVVKDFINAPAQAIPSLYVPVASVVEAVQGRPERGKQLLRDLDQGDPIYNVVVAGIEAAKGNRAKARERLARAERATKAHPGFVLLEVAGAKGALGRGAGRTVRVSGRAAERTGRAVRSPRLQQTGRRVHSVGSTRRAPRRVEGTNLVEERSYSPDLFRKGGQVLNEKGRRAFKRVLERQAEREADPGRAADLRKRAADIDPDRVPVREIQRRMDERVQAGEDVRRSRRAAISHEVRRLVKGQDVSLSLVTQRITRADVEDLRAYRDELAAEAAGLTKAKLNASKQLRRELTRVIDSGRFDPIKVERAAAQYREIVDPIQRELVDQEVLSPGEAETAKLKPYAVRRMGAKNDPAHWEDFDGNRLGPGEVVAMRAHMGDEMVRSLVQHVPDRFVDPKGRPITAEQIRAHMDKHGEDDPAYVTQAPGQRGARNFYVASDKPPAVNSGRRTGEATRRGTFDADPEALVESAVRARGVADATENFRATIDEIGYRDTAGHVVTAQTRREIDQLARDAMFDEHGDPRPGAIALRPVRLNPFGGRKEQLDAALAEMAPDAQAESIASAIEAAVSEDASGPGPWALVPDAAAERIRQHMRLSGPDVGSKVLQLANSAFRRTVLSTSPSWYAGNIIEGLGRALLEGAGPRSYLTGRKVLNELGRIDPKALEQAEHRMIGGGHFSMADRQHVRRGAEQFAGTRLAPLATALGKFWRTPGPKQAASLWNHWTEFTFRTVNGRIESEIQTAMLGRALRKSDLMDERIIKLSRDAIRDAAQGLTNTATQVRFGREVDRMYGKYSKFSPAMRRMLVQYTPFAAWMVNSAYFVFAHVPREHPVVSGLIASMEMATEEWREEHGLDLFSDGRLPGFLQGSIPLGDGGKLRASRFTPFGAFGSPTETLQSQVLPMWSGVLAAFRGEDWKGRKLRVNGKDATELDRLLFAARAFAEATIPAYSTGKRVAEDGPGALNPFRPVKPKQGAATAVIDDSGGSSGTLPASVQDALHGRASTPTQGLPASVQQALEQMP